MAVLALATIKIKRHAIAEIVERCDRTQLHALQGQGDIKHGIHVIIALLAKRIRKDGTAILRL